MPSRAKAGVISIDLSAGTAQFQAELKKAQEAIDSFGKKSRQAGDAAHAAGQHTVSGTQAASAALRSLELKFDSNIRAAENFISKTLGLGSALKAAFPVVGAIAFGGAIYDLIKQASELGETFKKFQEAPTRITQGFQAITQPIRVASDELGLVNAKLENQIAKLQGKPQNGLKVALFESRVEADKLSESLNRAIEQVQKLLEQEALGSFKGFLTGTAPTKDEADKWKEFTGRIAQINIDFNEKINATNDPAKQKQLADARTAALKAEIDSEANLLRGRLRTAQDLEAKRQALSRPGAQGKIIASIAGVPIPERGGPIPQKQDQLIATLRGQLDNVDAVLAQFGFVQANAKLTKEYEGLQAAAANAKPYEAVKAKITELRTESLNAAQEIIVLGSAQVNPFAKAIIDAQAKAEQVLTELDTRLKEARAPEGRVKPEDRRQVYQLERDIALRKAQVDWQKKLDEGADALDLNITEAYVQQQKTLSTIREEIDAEKELTVAQARGAEAVYQAQEKVRLAAIQDFEIRKATAELDEQKHISQIKAQVVQINTQTDATERLNAAALGGLEARRSAEFENIRQSGQAQDIIDAQIRAQQARNQLEDTLRMKNMPASVGTHVFFQEMIDNAQSAALQMKEILTSAFEGINDTLSRAISGQKANWASLFQSMSQQLAKMALVNIETDIVGRLKLGTTGKVQQTRRPWDEKIPGGGGGILGQIGGVLGLPGGVKRDGSTPAAALFVQLVGAGGGLTAGGGGLLGGLSLPIPGAKSGPVTNEDLPILRPTLRLPGIKTGLGGEITDLLSKVGGTFSGLFKSGGFLNGLFKKGGILSSVLGGAFGGFLAEGGTVDPGRAYMVGERGPELFSPGTSGSITPNKALGSTHIYYSIDARGADPAAMEQRFRTALATVHNSAVLNAQQVNIERTKRTPQLGRS